MIVNKPRDPLVQTLLSLFVPLYIIYWSYVTGKDMEHNYGQKAPNILLLLVPGIIFGVLFAVMLIGTLLYSSPGEGDPHFDFLPVVFLLIVLSSVLMLVLSLVYYYKFGGIVEKIVGAQASRLLIFILFWFVSPAAVYIIQEKLNAVSAQPPPQPLAQAPVPSAYPQQTTNSRPDQPPTQQPPNL